MRRRALLAALALALTAAAAAAPAHAKTVWLCKPGLKDNPCTGHMDIARYSPAGAQLGAEDHATSRRPEVDCFYAYPTVSDQKTITQTAVVAPVPVAIVFLLLRKHLMRGTTAGAVKG